MTVHGLNQELAANVVDYRQKKGPFHKVEDLIKVGEITFELSYCSCPPYFRWKFNNYECLVTHYGFRCDSLFIYLFYVFLQLKVSVMHCLASSCLSVCMSNYDNLILNILAFQYGNVTCIGRNMNVPSCERKCQQNWKETWLGHLHV